MTLRHPVFLVFVGGMLGGGVRLALDAAVPPIGALPWDLVVINIVGSAALGAIDGYIAARGARWWWPLVGTGMLGGFTTFSSIAALEWTSNAGLAASWAVLIATMAAAVIAAVAGRRWAGRRWAIAHDKAPA